MTLRLEPMLTVTKTTKMTVRKNIYDCKKEPKINVRKEPKIYT